MKLLAGLPLSHKQHRHPDVIAVQVECTRLEFYFQIEANQILSNQAKTRASFFQGIGDEALHIFRIQFSDLKHFARVHFARDLAGLT